MSQRNNKGSFSNPLLYVYVGILNRDSGAPTIWRKIAAVGKNYADPDRHRVGNHSLTEDTVMTVVALRRLLSTLAVAALFNTQAQAQTNDDNPFYLGANI